MASLSNNSWISEDDLLRTDHIMIAVPSVVFVARVIVQFYRRGRRFEWQDGWLYLAFAAFIAFSTCYVIITPIFFKLEKLVQDPTNPDNLWPTMAQDTSFIAQVMWCSGMMFWTCLWGVKFSFLALYKKLLVGLSRTWFWVYWGIVAFSVVAYISCIITGPVIACNDTQAFLKHGQLCSHDDESRRQTVNLYYAYAIDVVTNLMVMFLPLRLVMPLQMAPVRKFGVAMLFMSGFVIIIFSTIRVVQVTTKTSKHKSPDAKWITMWTIIECSTAIVVGCCPVLASLIPRLDRVDYDTNGYVRQGRRASNEAGSNNEVRMESLNSAQSKKTKNNSSELSWTDPTDEYVQRQEAERAAKAARDAVPPVPEDDVRRTDPRNVRNLRRMR